MRWTGRWRVVGVSIGVCCALIGGTAAAQDAPVHYRAGDKLVRGAANIVTGFIEIPRNIQNTTAEQDLLAGWTVGLGKGLGYTVLRMVTGLYEVVTFPFQAPKGYRPIIEPEYVWQASGFKK